ncbi:MAG: hypothetical protein QOC78_1883 [Solirubrobacteraceae bacterium]|jgi:hypothetical protein|nr:hypothetical protein [Solirubrobacteraceae bacterium]
MESSNPAHVLVVAHRTAATPKLLAAIKERASRGPCWFHLLVPNPVPADWHPAHAERHRKTTEGERVLALALPLIEEAARRPTDGSVSTRHDPMDAIEEALHDDQFDEIILSTLPAACRGGCTSTCPTGSRTSACPSRPSSRTSARRRTAPGQRPA